MGTPWPSWHLAKLLPFRPDMLRLSAPARGSARCKAESCFRIAPLRLFLGFCQRTPNGHILEGFKPEIEIYQIGKAAIISTKIVSGWLYQEMSTKLWNLQSMQGWLASGFDGINQSSAGKSNRGKGRILNFKSSCCSKPGHVVFQDSERRLLAFPAYALGQQREWCSHVLSLSLSV